MNRLVVNDSSRLVALLDDALQKLMLLGHLPEQDDGSGLMNDLDDEARRVVHSLWEQERRVSEAALEHPAGPPDDAHDRMHLSAREVSRFLAHHPRTFSVLQGRELSSSAQFGLLVAHLERLRKQVARRLSTTVTEDEDVEAAALQLDVRMQQLKKTATDLHEGLAAHRARARDEVSNHEAELAQLRQANAEQAQLAGMSMDLLENQLADDQAQGRQEALDQSSAQTTKLTALVKVLGDRRETNHEAERVGRLRHYRARLVDDEEVERKEAELEKLRQDYDALSRQFQDECEQVEALDKHFDLIDLDLANEREEMQETNRRHAAFHARWEVGVEKLNVIMAHYRGQKARSEFLALKKKRKKGKKKGKKKRK